MNNAGSNYGGRADSISELILKSRNIDLGTDNKQLESALR